jgi:DNA-directed RNA polymerase specialized sigma24 family protein
MTPGATAFDDHGKPVQAVGFVYPADEPEPEPPDAVDGAAAARTAFDRRRAAAAIIEILIAGTTMKQAGQRAFVLAYVLKLCPCRTQKELAKRLGVTPGRVSQILNAVKRAIAA